jgi:hypothetical protein
VAELDSDSTPARRKALEAVTAVALDDLAGALTSARAASALAPDDEAVEAVLAALLELERSETIRADEERYWWGELRKRPSLRRSRHWTYRRPALSATGFVLGAIAIRSGFRPAVVAACATTAAVAAVLSRRRA